MFYFFILIDVIDEEELVIFDVRELKYFGF